MKSRSTTIFADHSSLRFLSKGHRAIPKSCRLGRFAKTQAPNSSAAVVVLACGTSETAGNRRGMEDLSRTLGPRCELWCWNIYLQNWVIFRVNVGKYSSTMEHMGL